MDKLATKVIEVGGGEALVYPGGYEDFLYWKKQREAGRGGAPARRAARRPRARTAQKPRRGGAAPKAVAGGVRAAAPPAATKDGHEDHGGRCRPARQRHGPGLRSAGPAPAPAGRAADRQAREREAQKLKARIAELEKTIAEKEQAVRDARAPHGLARLLRRPRARGPGGGRPPAPARRGGRAHGRVGGAAGGVRRATAWPSREPSCVAPCAGRELAGVVLAVPLLVLVPGTLAAAARLLPDPGRALGGGRRPRPRRSSGTSAFLAHLSAADPWTVNAAIWTAAVLAAASPSLRRRRRPSRSSLSWPLLGFWALFYLALVGFQGMTPIYAGGNWYGDWWEHYSIAQAYIRTAGGHETVWFGDYNLASRTPLFNLVTAFALSLFGDHFWVYQVASTVASSLFLPAIVLLVRELRGRAGRPPHRRLRLLQHLARPRRARSRGRR